MPVIIEEVVTEVEPGRRGETDAAPRESAESSPPEHRESVRASLAALARRANRLRAT